MSEYDELLLKESEAYKRLNLHYHDSDGVDSAECFRCGAMWALSYHVGQLRDYEAALEGASHMFKAIQEDLKFMNPMGGCNHKCNSYGHDVFCGTVGLLALDQDEEVIAVRETLAKWKR